MVRERTLFSLIASTIGISSIGASAIFTIFLPFCQHELHLSSEVGYKLFSTWLTLFFMLPVVSGYIGQKYLGYRTSIILGLGLAFIGLATTSIGNVDAFKVSLVLFSIGASLYSTNIYSLFSSEINTDSKKRSKSFVIFYVAMNAGAFLGDFLSGFLIRIWGYPAASVILSTSLLASMLIFMLVTARNMQNKASSVNNKRCFISGYFLIVPIASLLFIYHAGSLTIIPILVLLYCIGYLIIKNKTKPIQYKQNARYLLFYAIFTIGYWGLYMLFPSVVEVFTGVGVTTRLFGHTIQPSTIASLSPLFLIFFGLLLSSIRKNTDTKFAIQLKIALALLFISASFYAIHLANNHIGSSTLVLLLVTAGYALYALSEIFIGPTALAMIGLLVHEELLGIMMGFAYLIRSIAGLTTDMLSKSVSINHDGTFSSYGNIAVFLAIILFLTLKLIHRKGNAQ